MLKEKAGALAGQICAVSTLLLSLCSKRERWKK